MRHGLIRVAAATLAIATATGGFAEDSGFDLGEAEPSGALSPFEFAKSGAKAERAKEAEASGAKVVGGELAAEGAWPWQVALLVAGAPVSSDSQFCGGSIVLDQWILTAAHCTFMPNRDGSFTVLGPQDISVLAGTNNLIEGSGDLIPIEAIFRHPSYDETKFDFDIALLKLARPPSVAYQTIEVPDAEYGDILNQQGVTTVVTGWGLQNGGMAASQLQQAEIQVIDRELCNSALMEASVDAAAEGYSFAIQTLNISDETAYALWDQLVSSAPNPFSENMICSGTFEGGKLSCNGDSGGPLVVPVEGGGYIQAGIVSWGLNSMSGYGCEETALFSAYTNISKFVPWLNEVIEANP